VSDQTPPRPPAGLGPAGRRLWRTIVAPFDLEGHERELLRQACRTADLIDGLAEVVDREGLTATSPQGVRVHPAVVELRMQRTSLARLVAALGIPDSDDEDRDGRRSPAPRGVRSPYRLLDGGRSS
jgi:phage terminase small subunit